MAVDNGSIAEAARRLNLTAAGVAKRIRALESEIGAVLVTRSGRTIRASFIISVEFSAIRVDGSSQSTITAKPRATIRATARPPVFWRQPWDSVGDTMKKLPNSTALWK